jgi:ATP-dependent Lon protease
VDVGKLKEKEWRPKAFERLVLEKERKDTLIRLASTNSRQIQSFKSKDVIEGKGKGMILLLHGPPGVGKTVS